MQTVCHVCKLYATCAKTGGSGQIETENKRKGPNWNFLKVRDQIKT
jgi:hypothetical protein